MSGIAGEGCERIIPTEENPWGNRKKYSKKV